MRDCYKTSAPSGAGRVTRQQARGAVRLLALFWAKEKSMSLYQRGKSWYYDFLYRSERYTGCIGPVSKTVAKEVMAKKKAEAVEGRYELPSKKPSSLFEVMAEEYMQYY